MGWRTPKAMMLWGLRAFVALSALKVDVLSKRLAFFQSSLEPPFAWFLLMRTRKGREVRGDSMKQGESTSGCILFNDLLLNYTVTSDLTRCAPKHVQVEGASRAPPPRHGLPREGGGSQSKGSFVLGSLLRFVSFHLCAFLSTMFY